MTNKNWNSPSYATIWCFLGTKRKISSHHFLPCPPVSERVWLDPPAPKPWDEIGLAQNPIFGVQGWPWGPCCPNNPLKNYLQGVQWTLKSLWHFFSVMHRQTNTRNTNRLTSTRRGIFLHMCLGDDGKLWTLWNFYFFYWWRITPNGFSSKAAKIILVEVDIWNDELKETSLNDATFSGIGRA